MTSYLRGVDIGQGAGGSRLAEKLKVQLRGGVTGHHCQASVIALCRLLVDGVDYRLAVDSKSTPF